MEKKQVVRKTREEHEQRARHPVHLHVLHVEAIEGVVEGLGEHLDALLVVNLDFHDSLTHLPRTHARV